MKDFIDIRTSAISIDSVSRKTIIDYYNNIVSEAKELNIWDDSIKKIIVTDDIVKNVNEQAQEWGLPLPYLEPIKRFVTSKIFWNNNLKNPEVYIFIDFHSFLEEGLSSWDIFMCQALKVNAEKIIPDEIKAFIVKGKLHSLSDWIKRVAVEWCKTAFAQKRFAEITKSPVQITNHNNFLIAFKRNLKRNLFRYNGDYSDHDFRLRRFAFEYMEGINVLITRIIENYTDDENEKISDSDEYRGFIYEIVNEVYTLTENSESGIFKINELIKAIQKFSDAFAVHLIEDSSAPFRISLTKDPKDYFIDELVDTEPRIVCFMDILGFKDLVDEYDNNYESTILSDIHESFEMARKAMFEYKLPMVEEFRRHLKHQTFSDNICISMPYFDNEYDFTTNFNLILIFIRGFQASMLTKGILIRGGISIGSFYSDDNIIFSKGLIKAYYLESKNAVYPRVVIDPEIIEKLKSYNLELISDMGTVIILDWENTAFVNPFDLTRYMVRQVESMIKDLAAEKNEEDPLLKVAQGFTRTSLEELKKTISDYYSQEEREIDKIIAIIGQKIKKYQDNQHVLSKYIWMLEFIKWYQKNDSGNLKFKTLTDSLSNN